MGEGGRTTAPTSLVLVHGAWHGGWCWSRLRPPLNRAGIQVFTPTLTGLADRAHLLSPEVDLETHVKDVVGLIECEELQNVVVVGHSYAGMLLGSVARQCGSRVGALVYLDALVPQAGECALQLFSPAVAGAVEEAARRGGGWRVPPPWSAAEFGVAKTADQAWVDRRLTDQPFKTFRQAAATSPPAAIPRTYVACTRPQRQTYVRFAELAREDPDWHYVELATGHDAMVTAPDDLARMLLQVMRHGI
jgi:pimeloyl-ACP methyl ester carboxylesterase